MSAAGYGAEMCACSGYADLMRDWEQADEAEAALDAETEHKREALDAWQVSALLSELRECSRPALARALERWLDAYAADSAEQTLAAEAEAWRRGDYCGD